jgi:hypothetical protein
LSLPVLMTDQKASKREIPGKGFSNRLTRNNALFECSAHTLSRSSGMCSSVNISRAAASFSRSVLRFTLFAREKDPIRIAVSQTAPVAQIQAESFLFLEQRHGLLQPAPVSQDQGLVAAAPLQTVLISQLQAERFHS